MIWATAAAKDCSGASSSRSATLRPSPVRSCRDERAAAYAALEATQDAALGAGCVAALAAVLGRAASEVDGVEWRRCSLVLAQLAQP